ncbi:MAG: rhodanese-related sulfurtransferase [Opitutales bacterium]|nr:rhodanese-related sulfurtransferase [Opitutales bacterium]MCH8539259.1 rhodanese-related sulfurtransferase [Opitutales bacterium]
MDQDCPDCFAIAALYCFTDLPDADEWAERLRQEGERCHLSGTFIVAEEGVNGTVAAEKESLEQFLRIFDKDERFAKRSVKLSCASFDPFSRYKVKRKKEIVSFRQAVADPRQNVGKYIKPAEWNDLLTDPEILLVDTRNDYEVEVGKFSGAVNPQTQNFTQFAQWVKENLDPQKHTKVAMYCTGGIRCEKATSYLLHEGFREVYHLEGGILQYLAEVPKEKSRWEGDCFVFDDRVAVDHHLRPTDWVMDNDLNWPVKIEKSPGRE